MNEVIYNPENKMAQGIKLRSTKKVQRSFGTFRDRFDFVIFTLLSPLISFKQ